MPYAPHPAFTPPADQSTSIWRYMDFSKFVWFLENNALYFSRLDKFADPYEGSLPLLNRNNMSDEGYDPVANCAPTFADRVEQLSRNSAFVNCWHMNEHESAAMWQLYSRSGIAVRSTLQRLCGSLQSCPRDVYVGIIRYVDFEKDFLDPLNRFNLALTKRRSFEHERELRVAVRVGEDAYGPDGVAKIEGLTVDVELKTLVQAVYVAPTTPDWLTVLVQQVAGRCGLESPIIHSKLYSRAVI